LPANLRRRRGDRQPGGQEQFGMRRRRGGFHDGAGTEFGCGGHAIVCAAVCSREGWQWTPDLIWFDNLRSFGTPNYYVQKLFSTQVETAILPVKIEQGAGKALFGGATRDEASGDVIIKLVNTQSAAVKADVNLAGMIGGAYTGLAAVLSSDDLKAVNSLDEPTKAAPVESKLENVANQFKRDLPGYSVTVLPAHTS
jgi:alpha-L-arabinofuranosidase